jgi:chromate transporter
LSRSWAAVDARRVALVSTDAVDAPSIVKPTFREAALVWAKIGLLSFGGPAGQVALMHKELVERRRWIDDERFLHALNYCMLLPGPEAQQLATYIGWLLHRTRGGLVAGILFVVPGFLAILGLSVIYAGFRHVTLVGALFFGLKAAVLALVVEALIRVGKRALLNGLLVVLSITAFVSLFFFEVSFPIVIAAAGVLGGVGARLAPKWFPFATKRGAAAGDTVLDAMARDGELEHTRPSLARALLVLVVGLVLWFAPLAVLALVLGPRSVWVDEGVFFSKAAVVTFGGAYAVLAYVAQQAVDTFGWLVPGEMVDGLGLAETTPGPLIMVVEFVGFMGAYRHPGPFSPMVAGPLGACVTTWVTFVPCFLWIFLGAPYVEAVRGNRSLHAALSAITAAVLGVIASLSIWFALHVVFARVDERHAGPIRWLVPDLSTFQAPAAVLAALAMIAMFRFHVSAPKVLAACAVAGAVWTLIAG